MTLDTTGTPYARGVDQSAAQSQDFPAWARILFVLATVVPIWRLAHLIHTYAIPVPFMDEWALVRIMVNAHNHDLTFRNLWIQHNEHRMLFPNLIFLALAQLGGWSVTRECWASLFVTVCSFCLVADLARRTVGGRLAYPLCLVLSWLMFSPMQFANFIIGFQLQWPLTVMAFIGSIWSLTVWQGRVRGLAGGILGATLASYSMAGGAMTWFIGLAYLMFAGEPRYSRTHRIVWIVVGVVCLAIFLHDFDWTPAPGVDREYWRHHPTYLTHYIGFYIGSSVLFICSWLTYEIGFACIAAYAYLVFLWTGLRKTAEAATSNGVLAWLLIGAFGLLNAITTGFGRCSLGVWQGGSSRYLTIANLLWIGLIAAALTVIRYRSSGPLANCCRFAGASAGALAVLIYFHVSIASGYQQVAQLTDSIRPGIAVLHSYRTAPDAKLHLLYFVPADMRTMCAALEQSHIAPFDHPVAPR